MMLWISPKYKILILHFHLAFTSFKRLPILKAKEHALKFKIRCT